MKKFLSSLLAFTGIANAVPPQQKPQTIDPKSIRFTTPTLSNDLAPLEPVARQPNQTDFVFHEDEWSQVEFFPKSQLPLIQQILKEYKQFELVNRDKYGWHNVYVRKIKRLPLISSDHSIQLIEHLLGVKVGPAPMLFSSNTISGQVKGGFSLPLGGNVTLYGYVVGQDIPVLGALVGKKPDDLKLTNAFLKLNRQYSFILVDWRAQLILQSVSDSGQINIWRP